MKNAHDRSAGRWRDRILVSLTIAAGLVVVATFLTLLADVVWRGAAHLSWGFLASAPRDSGRAGGIASILVSTSAILAVALAAALPIGLATAVLLAETISRDSVFRRFLRVSLDILAGTPSIVFGLFGNAFFCSTLGLGFSILSGGLTLACMILPILTRTVEAGLRAVPMSWSLGAAATGMTRAAALRHLILPAAAPAVAAGVMLGVGRALAETAALLFTSGYVDRMPGSLLDSGRGLAVHIYDLSMNVVGGEQTAYASALVLMAMLVFIHGCSQWSITRWMQRRILHP